MGHHYHFEKSSPQSSSYSYICTTEECKRLTSWVHNWNKNNKNDKDNIDMIKSFLVIFEEELMQGSKYVEQIINIVNIWSILCTAVGLKPNYSLYIPSLKPRHYPQVRHLPTYRVARLANALLRFIRIDILRALCIRKLNNLNLKGNLQLWQLYGEI